MSRRIAFLLLVLFIQGRWPAAHADPDGDDVPVARWSFDGPLRGSWHGKAKIEETNLQPPEYPALPAKNWAAYFPGKGVYLRVKESETPGNVRFEVGDSITLVAWVNPEAIGDGAHAYIVGKGRSGSPGFEAENQNYALRLTGAKKSAKVSFLFRSRPEPGRPGEYHRWISKSGFDIDSGWHHVAVTYTFGQPDSITAYLDGTLLKGIWDMGGATERPPVSDGDDIYIGSSQGGAAGNSFRGWLDDIVIYRTPLSPQTVGRLALHVPATLAVEAGRVPANRVLVEICENDVPRNAWPAKHLHATEEYTADVLGFFLAPHKYIDTGVRADRANPYLLRASALIDLPAGKHRLLLRGRGATRLFIDGKLLLSTPQAPPITDGHSPIPKNYLDLGPTFRFAPPGNRETWSYFSSPGKQHVVVLEAIVGGKRGGGTLRPELGETIAAYSPAGTSEFRLLAPKRVVPYTDAGWEAFADTEIKRLERIDTERRAAARKQHAAYWDQRRQQGLQWLAQTPEVALPPLPQGYPALNAIDHFIAAKIEQVQPGALRAAARAERTIDFEQQVRPILEARCFNCHQGQKARSGLRLDSSQAALRGGDSGEPALSPGQPDKSLLIARVISTDPREVMPPKGERLTPDEVALLRKWIAEGASWTAGPVRLTPLTDDLAFLRRVTLDTVGVVPTYAEIQQFLSDTRLGKRARAIDRLLDDPRWADHWVGYWQDVLAENPNILNPTLNNSGPFRWWIYEALLDDKPMDLFVTELVRMRGSLHDGGPAGFAMASENDVPMAEKGAIVAAGFLGVQMKCARCHDAPTHKSTQKELFQLAAMLGGGAITVPKTSSVPQDKIHAKGRKPLIAVTLQPGTKVEPAWPFAKAQGQPSLGVQSEATSRDQLAALLTAPQNERFAQVVANRIWQRLMGRGLVEPADDWEKGEPTHPELVRYLGRELVRSGYSAKQLTRLILNSHAYQRAADPALREPSVLYAAPARRRLAAEQILDSLFLAAGKELETEEINLDIDGGRDLKNSISLGKPQRAWQFASTSNERDRPSLSLPRVQAVVDVLEAFGWRGARQDPRSTREAAPNVLQPAVLANGPVAVWLTRLSEDHGATRLALAKQPLEALVDRLVLQVLTRPPSPEERAALVEYLREGYEARIVVNPPAPAAETRRPPKYVSWSNHLTEEANEIKIQLEAAARRGAAPTVRLEAQWRTRLEDVLWSLLNAPEFVFTP